MEYDQWFGAILPAVQQARCVVPLGGTSSHLYAKVWRDIGGWDEHNVTEDADLGVRLARHGYRTLILDSVTYEEANSDVINWIRQRSRWYKGYLQTLIVHMRKPAVLVREIGLKATLRLINLTGLVPIMNAVNLLLWSTMLVWIAARPEIITLMFPPTTYYLSITMLMLAAPLSVFTGLVATVALGKPKLWWAALIVPLYWLLQSVAAVKAIRSIRRWSYETFGDERQVSWGARGRRAAGGGGARWTERATGQQRMRGVCGRVKSHTRAAV
jgi:cellulose synthase/poly-beta-1,6-N-acetylglucosamine synthase-like glycosyltransferase